MSLLSFLKDASPLLATALGGPMAGVAVKAMANLLDSTETKDDILHALNFERSGAEGDFDTTIKKCEAAVMQAIINDKQDARKREIAVMKVTGSRDWIMTFLVVSVTLGMGAMMWALYFREMPIMLSDSGYELVGVLKTAFIMVLSYYFGSSFGSRMKDERR